MPDNSNDLVLAMFKEIGELDAVKKSERMNERMSKAERLFRDHSSILMTPIIYDNPINYGFFFAARDNPTHEASFHIPAALLKPNSHRNVICFSNPHPNHGLAISYASMLTFLGRDVYAFSVSSRKEMEEQEGEPEARIELFDPRKHPDLFFVLSPEHYETLFGIKPC